MIPKQPGAGHSRNSFRGLGVLLRLLSKGTNGSLSAGTGQDGMSSTRGSDKRAFSYRQNNYRKYSNEPFRSNREEDGAIWVQTITP